MTIVVGTFDSWVRGMAAPDAQAKLSRFSTFGDGWAFGEGVAFDPRTIKNARLLVATGVLYEPDAIDVFPGIAGQIVVTFYRGDELFDFSVTTDHVSLSHERSGEEVGEPVTLSVLEALQQLSSLGATEWRLYEYSMRTGTQFMSGALRGLPLSPTLTAPAYRYSTRVVRLQSQRAPAYTQIVSTGRLSAPPKTRSIFGDSMALTYQQGTG